MARGAQLLTALAILLAALLPRLAAIGRYVTPDELNWVYRSLGLRRALLAADWPQTLQSGHPGVTTTWIGAIAAQLQLWLQPQAQQHLDWLARLQQLSTDNVEAYRQLYVFLNGGRLGVALVASAGLALAYLLARDLIGGRAALLACLLVALDPFSAGLSGLLHVDGLLATFVLLALLWAMRATRRQSPPAAILAGLCTALAVLTKTPGALLLAIVPPILASPAVAGAVTRPARREALLRLLLWAGAGLATSAVLLPALWAAPRHVLQLVGGLNSRLLEDAVRPSFFLGQLALEHGPLFYPLAAAVRLSPVSFIGLLAAVPFLAQRRRDGAPVRWLALFAIFMLVALTLAAKKFDRYALPALLLFIFVAAWGLVQAAQRMRARRPWLLIAALLVQGAFLLAAWPHPLTASNWLLGGHAVARHVLPLGWGEDAGLAARTLARLLPAPQRATLFSANLAGVAPFFPGEIIRRRPANLARLQPDHHVLTLAGDVRDRLAPTPEEVWLTVLVKGVGTAVVQTGLDARAMGAPPLQSAAAGSRFGPGLTLQSAGAALAPWPGEALLQLTWLVQQPSELAPAYQLQMALVDAQGQAWLQRETPLLNRDEHTPADWASGAPQLATYAFQVPPTLAPGAYTWVLRVFDHQGSQQPVSDSAGAFAGTELAVAPTKVAPPLSQPPLEPPNAPQQPGPIAGFDDPPPRVTAGDPFSLELWWRAPTTEPAVLVLHLGAATAEVVLQGEGWHEGHVVRLRPTWRLPLQLAPGAHELRLSAHTAGGEALTAQPVSLGRVQVETRERLAALPDGLDALQVAVGDLAWLQQVQVDATSGETIQVQVVWQARQTTFQNLTTFVHLLDGGQMIAGADRQPAPPTSSWAAGEVIVDSYSLPHPGAGAYRLALGLYDGSNGARLPLVAPGGERLAGDQLELAVEAP